MVGCFQPNPKGTSGKYRWISFSTNWKPAVNGSKRPATIDNLSLFCSASIETLNRTDGRLVHWSEHEEKILREYLNEQQYSAIEPFLFNLRIPAKKYARRVKGLSSRGKTLEDFFEAMDFKRNPNPPLKIGAAESCRQIDKACAEHIKWSHFTERQKNYVHDLIAYNEGEFLHPYVRQVTTNSMS